MRILTSRLAPLAAALILTLVVAPAAGESAQRPLELTDLMKFRTLHDPVISEDGAWIAYESRPDRGDGEVRVLEIAGDAEYTVERGSGPAMSADGRWVGGLVQPTLEEKVEAEKEGEPGDQGPETGFTLLSTADGSRVSYERVKSFAFSEDGRWVAVHHVPAEDEEEEEAEELTEPEEPPEPAEPTEPAAAEESPPEAVEPEAAEPTEPTPEVEGVVQRSPSEEPGEEAAEEEEEEEGTEGDEQEEEENGDERVGSLLVVRELATGEEVEIEHVERYAFSEVEGGDSGAEGASHLAVAVAAPGGDGNSLRLHRLSGRQEGGPDHVQVLHRAARGHYTALAWAPEHLRLGFVAAIDDEEGDPGDADVWVWAAERGRESAARTAATSTDAPEGWFVPSANELDWSEDGERLFFGYKPVDEKVDADGESPGEGTGGAADGDGEETEEPFDPYDVEAILEDRGVDVWHWDDPLIIPQQKEQWEQEKDRIYRAVWHRGQDRVVHLTDRTVRLVEPVDNPHAALAFADVPYLKEITWSGWFRDIYRVDLEDGSRQLVTERLPDTASLSPGGRYVAYYRTPHWYLFDGETATTRSLTSDLDVPFADEDHDYPHPAPGYGVADWVEGDGSVLIYDKYDLWQFPTAGGEPVRLTAGRPEETVFRVQDLDPETDEELDAVGPDEHLLLSGYHDARKHRGFFTVQVGEPGARTLVEQEGKTYSFIARAREADRLLFSRESYREFPDLWTADLDLSRGRLADRTKRTDANPQIAEHAWGEAELVEWTSADGTPLQGVLIKPADYEEGRRYPVLVYYYRLFTPVLHRFNQPVVNHRPSFPHYASNGYAVFLPDIRFEVGRPGLAATKCLVSGVQHLIETGIADPDAIGLHGHSWSGYQTAFVVTQTDLFAAAVAGAPVSNMTSAYGGIRYGSGLARQFQYEESQSRLGASLWEGRDRYIENSPLFYADRVTTPTLLMFGDEDGAVPWTQGIELYLAFRRLGKEAFFLQYRGEGHHLDEYGNKLDYSIKMREFFDHYLKGAPAPEWITDGVPYRGE